MDKTINNAYELADDAVKQELKINWLQRATELKQQTDIFLRNIKHIRSNVESFNLAQSNIHKLKRTLSTSNTDNAEEIVDEIKKLKEVIIDQQQFMEFLKYVDNYVKQLNLYFGQTIKTVYVYKNARGEVKLYEVTGTIDEVTKYRQGSHGRGAGATYKSNVTKNAGYREMEEIPKNENLIETYKEALSRALATRKKLKAYNLTNNTEFKGMYVYWQLQKDYWEKMKVNTTGDLAEGYAYFALDEARGKVFRIEQNLEKRIGHFMLKGVAQVDSISGLFWGDVQAGQAQYAIKAAGASTMGYKQVLELADSINIYSPEQIVVLMEEEWNKIQEKINSPYGQRNKRLNEAIDQEINNILDDFIKITHKK